MFFREYSKSTQEILLKEEIKKKNTTKQESEVEGVVGEVNKNSL